MTSDLSSGRQRCRRAAMLAAACFAASIPGTASLAQPPWEQSPAAAPVPETETPQTYAADLVDAGRGIFATNCGFCHGRDTAGGAGGSDLTRSMLVAGDVRGDQIIPVVRAGRADAGMPAFPNLGRADLDAIVAFVHERKTQAEQAVGGRRSVTAADLETGNARAGRRFFEANCTACHRADGDLDGIGRRYEGLALMRRMLYPGSEGRGGPMPAAPGVTVTTAAGDTIAGTLEYRDEFTIALVDSLGRYRSWSTADIEYSIDDPLSAHVALLDRYTDEDMHDVFRFLQSLR